ncbi:MAG: hypothetical protein GY926_04495 [bacterium]|nr:hypothetical protein [bacterium]MCP4964474.1 hypothetical protein [bacterium]
MSRQLFRLVAVASLAGVFLATFVGGATAAELEDFLDEADQAIFSGRQATWCSYSGHTEFSVVDVEHAGALVMVENAGSSQMVGGGRYSVVGGSGAGIAITDWSSTDASSRYSTSSVEADTRLGRDVVVVSVDEEDKIRARIWFDKDTGAALGSEIYDSAGDLFRLSWMLDFDTSTRKLYAALRESGSTYDVVVSADGDGLPDVAAGYTRSDTYAGPDESLHAFYTDGLFSFSIFVIEGRISESPFVDADSMSGGQYRWILTPSELWVQWSGDGLTYVLVGDLPPDHLDKVLPELPQPAQANILSRLWHGLFG